MINSHLRAISVEYFQAIALWPKDTVGLSKSLSGLTSAESRWFLIAVNTLTHKIIGREISYFQDHIRKDIGK